MNRYIWAALGMGIVGIGYYGTKKYRAAKKIIENVQVKVLGIRNIRVSYDLQKINFTLGLKLINTTKYDIGFTTNSHLFLKHIKIITPTGQEIANASTGIHSIAIAANAGFVLPDIQVEMRTRNLIDELPNIAEYITSGNLIYILTIEAFGKDFTITT